MRRTILDAGHAFTARSPNFVASLLDLGIADGLTIEAPFEEPTPGLAFGFRKGAKPDLTLKPAENGELEITLQRRTSSPWLTIEIDWKADAFQEKGKTSLLIRGASPEPLSLTSVLRWTSEDGNAADLTGRPVVLGPDPALQVIEFAYPGDAAVQSCRILLFCPINAFSMTLTELSIL